MKTINTATIAADPVISEVRRAKTEVARKFGFDVMAMVRALRQIDEEEDANSMAPRVTPTAEQEARPGQP